MSTAFRERIPTIHAQHATTTVVPWEVQEVPSRLGTREQSSILRRPPS